MFTHLHVSAWCVRICAFLLHLYIHILSEVVRISQPQVVQEVASRILADLQLPQVRKKKKIHNILEKYGQDPVARGGSGMKPLRRRAPGYTDVLVVRKIDCGNWLARECMLAHHHCGLFYPLVCGLA